MKDRDIILKCKHFSSLLTFSNSSTPSTPLQGGHYKISDISITSHKHLLTYSQIKSTARKCAKHYQQTDDEARLNCTKNTDEQIKLKFCHRIEKKTSD